MENIKIILGTQEEDKYPIKLEIDNDYFKKTKKQIITNLKKNLNIEGFRKGHAPDNMVISQYGEAKIEQEVLAKIYNQNIKSITSEFENKCIMLPPIPYFDNIEILSREPLICEIKLYAYPNIKVDGYKKLITKLDTNIKVADADIDNEIKYILSSDVKFELKKDAIVKDDKLKITFIEVKDKDNNIITELNGIDTDIIVSNATKIIPNVEKYFIGKKMGDNIEIEEITDENYILPKLKNQKLFFKINIKEAYKSIFPEFTEDIIEKKLGKKMSVKEARDFIKEKIIEFKKRDNYNKALQEIEHKLCETYPVNLSPIFINTKAGRIYENFISNLSSKGLDKEKYLQMIKKTEEEWIEKEILPLSKKLVHLEIIMNNIAKKEKIYITPDDVKLYLRENKLDDKTIDNVLNNPILYNDVKQGILKDKLEKFFIYEK